MDQQHLNAPTCANTSPGRRVVAAGYVRRAPQPQPDPSDLTVAIRVGQKMLATYGDPTGFDVFAYAQAHGGLAEALRILLRALNAETGDAR
ncbi:hypothetical protein [Streptomyces shenzhenensis]|uniref:Uncharacterized protein n=1 Tax=Streptomyces shenzhenensis TaxID=943815 RepID=A0A3M0HW96_9ACTN|nr:hypothetical protein [Streptomyces shenzhenensis]RMB81297.1 hypothetical protein CTZ28_35440 [Streptomyces shenzhenensis]